MGNNPTKAKEREKEKREATKEAAVAAAFSAAERTNQLILRARELQSLPLPSLSKLSSTTQLALTTLDISQNQLTLLPPELFTCLPSLTNLDCSENALTSLPSTITTLTSLTDLNLNRNKLRKLPDDIHTLRKLSALRVYGNELRSLPKNLLTNPPPDLSVVLINENWIDLAKIPSNFVPKLNNAFNNQYISQEIIPNLYLGSGLAAKNKKHLQEKNITHILSVTDIPPTYPHEFEYLWINIEDTWDADVTSHFKPMNDFIEKGRNRGGALVHCSAGISRSSAAVIAYIMWKEKKTYMEAREIVMKRRPCIEPNPGFVDQLKEYQKSLGLGSADDDDDKKTKKKRKR
jgi:protein-tyrosine phosphatase